MGISVSALVKGISNIARKKKKLGNYPKISWVREKLLKHQDDVSVKSIQFKNIAIEYKRPYELLHTYKELFEDEIYRFDSQTTAPLILDCGANIGLSVIYFKTLYPNSKVIAFEPDAENFDCLKRNVAANNLSNVECLQKAVWINNDSILFDAGGTQGSGISSGNHSSSTTSVEAVRLSDILKSGKVDFLKIDIEGAELEVIRDCAPHLTAVESLFVEYHGKANETHKLAELLDILEVNFSVYIKLAADSLQYPFVQKASRGSFDVQLNIFCYLKEAASK